MKNLNNKGISLIETIAAIVIITFVIASSLTIIVNIRNQTYAANEKINAIEVGTMVRDNLINDLTYNELFIWLEDDTVVTNQNCLAIQAPISCDVFNVLLDGKTYDEIIEITFYMPNATDIEY